MGNLDEKYLGKSNNKYDFQNSSDVIKVPTEKVIKLNQSGRFIEAIKQIAKVCQLKEILDFQYCFEDCSCITSFEIIDELKKSYTQEDKENEFTIITENN